MIENIFTTIIEISITTSIVIAFLLIISPFVKKTYVAKWRYFAWFILAVRLIIPINFTLPTPPVTLSTPNNTIVYREPTNNIEKNIQTMPNIQTNNAITDLEKQINDISLMELMVVIWIVGIVVFILYNAITYITLKKLVKRWCNPITNSEAIAILNKLCDEMITPKNPKLMLCKKVNSPMIIGFINPLLLLPSEDYSYKDLEVILKHELIHLKRKDIWYKVILLFANAIHWFNPLVYIMLKYANIDLEISCDNEVVNNTNIEFRKSYSQAILTVLNKEKQHHSVLSTYCSFNGSKKIMRNRFENIFDMGKKKQGIVALCLVLIITVTSGVFVACNNSNLQGQTVSELLYSSKSEYVGNNSKVTAIIDLLSVPTGITRQEVSLQTEKKPYGITVNYNYDMANHIKTDTENNDWQYKNAIIMFSLIGNVDEITFNMNSDSFAGTNPLKIKRIEAEEYFGGSDLREFAKTLESFKSFLAKVDAIRTTINENTPFKGLELYVWKNKNITGNDDTNFTLLMGTNRLKTEHEIYDLSIALNSIDKLNEMLTQYSDETYLSIIQMNTTDFTKDEMEAISDKIKIKSDNSLKSIGLYQPNNLKMLNDIPAEEENTKLKPTIKTSYKTMEEAIHDGLIEFGSKRYSSGEFSAEGHTIIDYEESDNDITVYAVISTLNFQFQNGFFTIVGGGGSHPVIIKLLKDDKGTYEFKELKEPMDGGMWEKSIKEMYPERLWGKIFPLSTKLSEYDTEISRQINVQAEGYLKSIGRNAEIKEYGEIGIKLLDIDSNLSNKLEELRKYDIELNKYPFWIGTQEWLENGERYIYENYQKKSADGQDIVVFKKTDEKGNVIEQFEYKY